MAMDLIGARWSGGKLQFYSKATGATLAELDPAGTTRIGAGASITLGGELSVASGGSISAAGSQAANIADPAGGATVDSQARAAIAAILDVLEGAGLMAAAS